MAHAVARREEELSALQEQLEHTQRELSSAKASYGCPLWLTMSELTAMGLSDVFMEVGGGGGPGMVCESSLGPLARW